jgi:single-stranded DNA-binding protein
MIARERLPNCRQRESFEFRHAGHVFTLCAGFHSEGRIAEIFLSSNKPGSLIEAIARDAAITVSIALQFGADIEMIRTALTKDHGGPAMIAALVQGSLFHAPKRRTSKSGRPFVSATVRTNDGGELRFISIVAFSDTAQAELLRLQDGDSLSVQGQLKAEVYEKDGEHRISLNMVANIVLAIRQPPRERKPKAADPSAQDTRSRQGTWTAASGDPDDSIPF